jgi:NitT/TauT family transport system permease protein
MSVERAALSTIGAGALADERERRNQELLAPRRQSFLQRNDWWLITLLSIATFLIVLELIVRLGLVKQTFLASPSQTFVAMQKLASSGDLWKHFRFSGMNFIVGFTLAALIGIPLGLALGSYRRLTLAISPYVLAINATPRIAFISLLIVWFGLGWEPKVILVLLSAFFPIVINTWAGVRVVDPVLLRAGRAYGATGWRLFSRVIMPFSLPFIMSGLRQGVGRGVVGLVGSELFGTDIGIGYLIITSGFNFRIPELFVGVSVLAFIGITSNELLEYAERRLAPWRQTNQR